MPFDTIVAAAFDADALLLRSARLFKVLRLIRLLKLIRLMKLRKTFAGFEGMWTLNSGFLRVLRLMTEVMFLAHFLACFWHFVPVVESPPESGMASWYSEAGITERTDLATRYAISLSVAIARLCWVVVSCARVFRLIPSHVLVISQCQVLVNKDHDGCRYANQWCCNATEFVLTKTAVLPQAMAMCAQ